MKYTIYRIESEFLRTKVGGAESYEELEYLMSSYYHNWERYEVNTPNGIKKATQMKFNPF